MRLRDRRTGEERDVPGARVPGALVARSGDEAWVAFRGETYRLGRVASTSPRKGRGAADEFPPLEAPMPGRIISVRVAAGALVVKGDVLVVLEAMKMEHAVRAPKDGTIERVPVAEGQMVAFGEILVVMA